MKAWKGSKKLISIVLAAVVAVVAIFGGVTFAARHSKSSVVSVYPVALLNNQDMFTNEESLTGTVTSDYLQ